MFSVIVPTYNRVALLSRTLESLFRQEYPDFEIIVANDGSTDGTDAYLSGLAAEGKIIYVAQSNSGPSIARKAGLHKSRGEFIAFTDDDCVLPPDWLRKMAARLEAAGVAGVGGAAQTGDPANLFAATNDLINNYFKAALNGRPGCAPYLTSNNVAYNRSNLLEAGGHDTRFRVGAEDRDLDYRIVKRGGTLVYDPAIVILHYNDAGLKQFVRHQFHQGRGSYLYYSVQREGLSRPPSIPPSVYAGLLAFPFRSFSFFRALLILCLIVLAQGAIAAGFVSALLHPEGSS